MFHFSGSRVHKPMYSAYDNRGLALLGYPIRTPPGLSSLAALRGFSQLVASFFACQHQGIHHKPLGSLYRIQPPVTRISKSFSRLIQSYESLLFLCMLDSYVICVSALHLEIVISHKIVGVAAFAAIYNFATRMSICRLPAFSVFLIGEGKELAASCEAGVEVRGLEPLTSSLQSWRSTN